MDRELSGDRQVVAEQQHVFSLMGRVERKYREGMRGMLSMVDVSAREHELLALISAGTARSPAALARASRVSRQLIHRVLNRLEAAKLIQRWTTGSDATARVGITARGQGVLEETDMYVSAFRESVLGRFGVQHHVALRALLVSLDEVLDEGRRRPELIEG